MTTWKVFRIPLLLAVISGLGLIAALMVEGPIDVVWTVLVAAPLGVIAAALVRAGRSRR